MAHPFRRPGYLVATEDWDVYVVGETGKKKIYIKVGREAIALGIEKFVELSVGNIDAEDLTDLARRARQLAKNARHSRHMRQLWKDVRYRRRNLRARKKAISRKGHDGRIEIKE
jgi:hypothetical protein